MIEKVNLEDFLIKNLFSQPPIYRELRRDEDEC